MAIAAAPLEGSEPLPRPAPLLTTSTAIALLFCAYMLWIAPITASAVVSEKGVSAILIAVACFGLSYGLVVLAPRVPIGAAAVVAFAAYVAWGVIVEVTPQSDFANFYSASTAFAARPGLRPAIASKSPPTIACYGSVLWLLGTEVHKTYVAAAAIWAIQIPLLASALAGLGLRQSTARTAALIYGFSPSVMFYAPLISSESVFNGLLVAGVWLASRYRAGPSLARAAALGASTGLLYLTRMNGAVFAVAFALYAVAVPGLERLRARVNGAAVLATFAAVAVLYGIPAYMFTKSVFLPSAWGAYNLMSGTNRASDGMYNTDDIVLAGFNRESGLTHGEASRNALRIGISRITGDPLGFAAFALTRKVERLWGTDVSAVDWPTQGSPRRQLLLDAKIIRIAREAADGFWLYLVVTATLALLWGAVSRLRGGAPWPEDIVLPILLPMLLLALLHVVIEVQSRYHIPFVPGLCALSALGLQAVRDGVAGRRGAGAPGSA